MLEIKVVNRHTTKLEVEGKTEEVYKEISLAVVRLLEALDIKTMSGKSIPLSRIITEFGQQLVIMAQCNKAAFDSKEE